MTSNLYRDRFDRNDNLHPLLDLRVEHIPTFGVRIKDCLKNAHVETLHDLVLLKPEEVFRIRNMGRRQVKIIERALTVLGLKLSMTDAELDAIRDAA